MSLKPKISNNLCCPAGHTSGGQSESERTWILAERQFLSVPSPGLDTSVLATVCSYSCVWLDSDFICRIVNSEHQLWAVVRQPTSIPQVPSDAPLALLHLQKSATLWEGRAPEPKGCSPLSCWTFYQSITYLQVRAHILKCPTQRFFLSVSSFFEHSAQIRQHYCHQKWLLVPSSDYPPVGTSLLSLDGAD